MAYKPSLRRKTDELEMELDIRPVMNLMVVLIPLLIAGAEWVKLGIIEINVPPAKSATGPGAGDDQNEQKEQAKTWSDHCCFRDWNHYWKCRYAAFR